MSRTYEPDDDELSVYVVDNANEYFIKRCEEIQNKFGPISGKVPKRNGRVWLAYYDHTLAGFALGVFHGHNFWLRNCVVARFARGKGLQKALINARVHFAQENNARNVITYTDPANLVSANNLIKCGFLFCGTEDGWVYWRKRL